MRRFVIYCMCAVASICILQAQDNIIDRVEWVVGDKAILRSDIEDAVQAWLANGQKFKGDPYCVAGEELAVQQLFLHQAILDSVEVNESFILQSVDQRMDYVLQNLGSKEKMEEYFRMNSSQIREMYYEMEYNNFMMNSMKRSIVGDIKVSPALVRRYYNSLPQDSIPFVQSQVEVQIITLEPEIEISEIERVKSELRDYTERVNNNETSFSTLALLYSEDPGSARRGGELDFVARAELDPEFANVAFNLTDPNKVSKIVESEYGFHIIQLLEKRGDRIKVRHILRKPRVSDENVDYMLSRLDTIANDIRNDSIKFEVVAQLISDDKDTRNNHGLMFNKMTASSRFELQDLPVDVARVVDNMKVGEISSPFILRQNGDKVVCAIVKLKSRVDGHKANIKDDYEKLRELYMAKMSEQKVMDWIKEKQKSTYVRVNSKDSRQCDFKYPGWVFYEDKE
ncbi:MAG: peptidylprolyl isomerase [Bacteroidaceae bacterium]|nr:peptidylprolyl isomerase [Bacteroidaceae bacterium]